MPVHDYEREVISWINKNLSLPFLEAAFIWSINPSSKTAKYGGDRICEDIRWNLLHRYPEDRVDEIESLIRERLPDYWLKPKRENLQTAVHEAVAEVGQELLLENFEKLRYSTSNCDEVLAALFDCWSSDEVPNKYWIDENARKKINRALKKGALKESTTFDYLVENGLIHRIHYVASKSNKEQIRYYFSLPLNLYISAKEEQLTFYSYSEMGDYEEKLVEETKAISNDIALIDALVMWCLNPTSISAGLAIPENLDLIRQNIMTRYTMVDSDSIIGQIMTITKRIVREIRDEYYFDEQGTTNFLMQELLIALYIHYSEALVTNTRKQILASSEQVQSLVNVLKHELHETGRLAYFPKTLNLEEWSPRLKNPERLLQKYVEMYGDESPPIDKLIEAGVLFKLCLKSSSNKDKKEQVYMIQPHIPLALIGIDISASGKRDTPKLDRIDTYVEETLSRYSSDQIFIEAFSGWSLNPIGMSADYGLDTNEERLRESLAARYGDASAETAVNTVVSFHKEAERQYNQTNSREFVQNLRTTIQDVISSKYASSIYGEILLWFKNASISDKRIVFALAFALEKLDLGLERRFIKVSVVDYWYRILFGELTSLNLIETALIKNSLAILSVLKTSSAASPTWYATYSIHPWTLSLAQYCRTKTDPLSLIDSSLDLDELQRMARSWNPVETTIIQELIDVGSGKGIPASRLYDYASRYKTRLLIDDLEFIVQSNDMLFLNPIYLESVQNALVEIRTERLQKPIDSLNEMFAKLQSQMHDQAYFAKIQFDSQTQMGDGYFRSSYRGSARIFVADSLSDTILQLPKRSQYVVFVIGKDRDMLDQSIAIAKEDDLLSNITVVVYDGAALRALENSIPFIGDLVQLSNPSSESIMDGHQESISTMQDRKVSSLRVDEVLFGRGQFRGKKSVYLVIQDICEQASSFIWFMDPFIDYETILSFLSDIREINVHVLTTRDRERENNEDVERWGEIDENLPALRDRFTKFELKYFDMATVKGRKNKFHARRIIIDNAAWTLDYSLKDAGKDRDSVIHRLRYEQSIEAYREKFEELWEIATVYKPDQKD